MEGQFCFPGTKAVDLFAQEQCGTSRNRQIVRATIESEVINAFGKGVVGYQGGVFIN